MPDTTPNLGLPFPEDGDPTDVAGDIKRLATAVDSYLMPPSMPTPKTTIIDSYESSLTWDQLPAYAQPDNGSLQLIDQSVKDAPVEVETGNMVEKPTGERDEHGNRVMEQVPETEFQMQPRTVYTYEADFRWDNTLGQSYNYHDVVQVKNNQLKSGRRAFHYCVMPEEGFTCFKDLDTSNLYDMRGMFENAKCVDRAMDDWFAGWDFSNVRDMSRMFYEFSANSDPWRGDFNAWDTGNVETMEGMFSRTMAFYKQFDISRWNVSKVKNMASMFKYYRHGWGTIDTSFTEWDTGSVETMESMFEQTTGFSKGDLRYWNVFNVKNFKSMFFECWFSNGSGPGSEPLDYWQPCNAENMDQMFFDARHFDEDISGWNVPKIASKPPNFDAQSGFEGQTAKQPQWGSGCGMWLP